AGSVEANLRCEREPTQQCGDAVQLPAADQLPEALGGGAAKGKFVMCGNAGLIGGSQCRWSPVSAQIVAVHDHLRLVLRLGNRKGGVHVQILRPRIVAADLQSPAQAANHVKLQRVITAVACGVPEESGA